MIVYLIGMPACGKTTIGKLLAKKTKATFIDLDDYISAKEGISITELFKTKGEDYFRELESKYLKEISETKTATVVSLGGGTPCFNNNLGIILGSGKVFYINTSLGFIYSRILRNRSKRPLFANLSEEELKEKIDAMLKQREPFYLQAHYHIHITDKSRDEVVKEIIPLLSKT